MRLFIAAAAVAILAASHAGNSLAGKSLVITVKSTSGPTTTEPHPPAGGVGDTSTSSLALVNITAQLGKPARAAVGTMKFTYTIRKQCTSFGKTCVSTADFQTVTTFPGGTVIAKGRGVSISTPAIKIPVVGGTGTFAGARGTVTMSPASTRISTYKLKLG